MSDLLGIDIISDYVNYNEVIQKFGKERVQERYDRLLDSAREFIKGMDYNTHVMCNETMLMYAVLGYYSDIMRLKDFHKIISTNHMKVFAYEATWLLKRKPLQIINSNDKKYAFCNEQFVFSNLMFLLSGDEKKDEINIFDNKEMDFFSDILFYHIKYRNYDPQTLELMLASFSAGRKYQQLLLTYSKPKETNENEKRKGIISSIIHFFGKLFTKNKRDGY